MIFGNDISRYQGEINFSKMKDAGSQFVYMRVGVGYNKDQRIDEYRIAAKEAGILWGLYWLPYATSMTGKLLDAYFNMVGDDWGDLPPAVDVETAGLGLGLFKEWVIATTLKWGQALPSTAPLIRRKPIFYTRTGHFDEYTNTKNIKQFLGQTTSLWVALYNYDPLKKPKLPRDSWDDYLLHQYSADENKLGKQYGVSSIAIDMDYFNGDEFKFAEWAGLGEMHNPQEPQVKHVRVAVDWLSFRSRPELYAGDRPAIGKGVICKVLDETVTDIAWYYVELSGGDRGYISAKPGYTRGA